MTFKNLLAISLFLLASAGVVLAATPVTVTGTVYDTTNHLASFGTVTFKLQPVNNTIFYRVSGTAIIAPTSAVCGINASGQLKNSDLSGNCQVWGNDIISPTGSSYEIIEAPNGTPAQDFTNAQITGTSLDLTNITFAPNVRVMPDLTTLTLSPLAVSLIPDTDNLYSLGSSGDRFASAYVANLFTGKINDPSGQQDRYKGFVNVVNDCNAIGDGVTNDTTSIQNCITNNPGRKIFFPKMCASVSGGGTASCTDFLISSSLTTSGNGQELVGEIVAGPWQGGPNIKMATADTTALIIPASGYGQRISNLEFTGPSCWSDSDLTTWPQNGSGDGIYVGGGEPTLENLTISCFNRHGINLDGSQGGQQPDHWHFKNIKLANNRGDGVFIHGGDSGAGLSELINVYSSNGWGIRDISSNGNNTHLSPETQGNHRDASVAAGSTANISTIAVAGNVVSVTTATNHGFSVGSWITVAGTVNFNGTVKVITVPTSTSFTFNLVSSAGSEATGTVKKESSTNVYANALRTFQKCSVTNGSAALICTDGNFYDDHNVGVTVPITVAGAGAAGANLVTYATAVANGTGATLNTAASTTVSNVAATVAGGWGGGPYNSFNPTKMWINPYMESNQPASKMTAQSTVIGGTGATGSPGYDRTYGEPLVFSGATTADLYPANGGLSINRRVDNIVQLNLQAGSTADQEERVGFFDRSGNGMYQITANFGGGASGVFLLKDVRNNVTNFAFGGGANANALFSATGSGVLQLQEQGATGAVETGKTFQCSGSGTCNLGATSHGFGNLFATEVAAPTGVAGNDLVWGDSTAHRLEMNNNNGGAFAVAAIIGSGTAAMTTAGIATGACGTTVTVGATGVATTDVINISHNAAATIGNGGGLTLNAWPTSGNVNFNYCNSSAGTITPTAMTINWQVTR